MTATDLLEGRVAIVTGGARGIGAAISEMLIGCGASVVIADSGTTIDGRDKDPSIAQQIADRLGDRARPYTEDMAIPAAAGQVVELAMDEFGGIDIVVNNAAILRDDFLFKVNSDDWDMVIRNNLSAAFYLLRTATPIMRDHAKAKRGVDGDDGAYGWGRIINIVSTVAFFGNYGQASYASAKGGLATLTRIAALDMARSGVTCNAIAPFAHTRVTDIIQPANPEQEVYKDRAQKVPTENVADLAAYICSPAASDVTGQVFGVRGREVFIFTRPQPAARVIAEGKRWQIDDLARAVDDELRPQFGELTTDLEFFNMEPFV
jgi:NAD(P)-dependent dehydrogenase (short-subunit alcohol dehydrogenase family)